MCGLSEILMFSTKDSVNLIADWEPIGSSQNRTWSSASGFLCFNLT